MSKIENVKTLKLTTGEEIIAREVKIEGKEYKAASVMCIGISPQSGQPALVPYVLTAGMPIGHNISIQKSNVSFIGQTDEAIAREYFGLVGIEESTVITTEQSIILN